MIMKKRSRSIAVLATLIIMLTGCYPQGPEYVEDLDVVLTNFQDEYDFSAKQTYALPDRIVKITGNLVDGDDPEFIPDATATLLLARIDQNMSELGWEKVGIDENPNVLLTPASWESTTIVYYYDYWSWWYGGYYPGWGYYYPSVSSYTTGTLVMAMIDPALVGANGNPVVQWTGAINGILTWSYDATRVNSAIDRAFDQSPYLRTN
jgi:predicted small lipoprotein YifL